MTHPMFTECVHDGCTSMPTHCVGAVFEWVGSTGQYHVKSTAIACCDEHDETAKQAAMLRGSCEVKADGLFRRSGWSTMDATEAAVDAWGNAASEARMAELTGNAKAGVPVAGGFVQLSGQDGRDILPESLRAFTSKARHEISGRGTVFTVENPGGLPEPAVLTGEDVLIDGVPYKVVGVETFRIVRPYPEHFDIGLLVR